MQVDIHPAARIGKVILLHHGIGVVIGETASGVCCIAERNGSHFVLPTGCKQRAGEQSVGWLRALPAARQKQPLLCNMLHPPQPPSIHSADSLPACPSTHAERGGTGAETGDRHPKIDRNVLIDASATILGNILIGEGSQIAAGAWCCRPSLPTPLWGAHQPRLWTKCRFPAPGTRWTGGDR